MGCMSSKSITSIIERTGQNASKISSLSRHEVELRIDAPPNSEKFTHSGITFKYAWASQRGYYPDSPDKENQDSYTILPSAIVKSGGSLDTAFFGVYDGHGNDGHLSSLYAKNQLPKNLFAMLSVAPDEGSKATEKAILKAHKITNEGLHADKSIDSNSSGTTSITILMKGRTMYVSNVGDSRAIVVSSNEANQIKVNAMSSDHTPFRKDERFRVMKYGARILSMDQMLRNNVPHDDSWGDITLGEDIDEAGDPPRVWALNGEYPGTAFTRSFGDKIAELLGVTAEPEILVREISASDRYIVIASDGVFEFMTNQMVADIVAENCDPLDACRAVIAAAYELWLRYDVRSDDITIIVLQIEEDASPSVLSPNEISVSLSSPYSPYGDQLVSRLASSAAIFGHHSPPALHPTSQMLEDSRPVRWAISREKKKKIVLFTPFMTDDEEEHVETSSAVMKTEKVAQAIAKAIKLNSLFQHLNFSQRCEVISLMQPLHVKEGDWVITQGDKGDNFYVVDHGRFEVRVKAAGTDEHNGGNVVHVYESGRDQHPGFGELALLYGNPRAASVIALTDGTLWVLDHNAFRRIVMRSIDNAKMLQRLLRKVQLFSCFDMDHIRKIAMLLGEEKFLAGEYIAREGEANNSFYVIVKGECECSRRGSAVQGERSGGETPTLKGDHCHSLSHSRTLSISGPEQEMHIPSNHRGAEGKESTSPPSSLSPPYPPSSHLMSSDFSSPNDFILTKHDHFGETCLLSPDALSSHSVLARTDVTVLSVTKRDFESHLGRFTDKMESYKATRDTEILTRVYAPSTFSDVTCIGLVSSDEIGCVLLGTFGTHPSTISVRSYVLRDVDRLKSSVAVLNSMEAFRVINASSKKNCFVFRLLSVCREPNALHLIIDIPVVADLDSLLTASSAAKSIRTSEDVVIYVATCVFSALEFLHSLGIIYRSLQPETLYVDMQGRVVLGSFRASKVGTVGGKTYTITGTTDYLAPEQVGRQGHSAPVDLWSLGVVLYELATGVHPFTEEGDTPYTTHSKISSYGTRAFPKLIYPEWLSRELTGLIERLLVPVPEMRLGAGQRGFEAVKEIFNTLDWDKLRTDPPPSPLASSAAAVREDMLGIGVDPSVLAAFSEEYHSVDRWHKSVQL